MNRKTIGLAMCGSFCTFARVLDAFFRARPRTV